MTLVDAGGQAAGGRQLDLDDLLNHLPMPESRSGQHHDRSEDLGFKHSPDTPRKTAIMTTEHGPTSPAFSALHH